MSGLTMTVVTLGLLLGGPAGERVTVSGGRIQVRLQGHRWAFSFPHRPAEVRWSPEGEGTGLLLVVRSGDVWSGWRFGSSAGRAVRWNLRIRTATVGGRRLLVCRREAGQWAAVVRPEGRRGLRVLWEGRLGPLGRDGELERRIEVAPGRLVISERPAGFRRCDGGPVRLFPRAYHPGRDRFLPVRFRPHVLGLPVLQARPQPPDGWTKWELTPIRFVFASSREGAGPGYLGAPRALQDRNGKTAWVSGETPEGAFLQAEGVAWPYGIVGVRFIPGVAAGETAWRGHGRLKRFLLWLGGYRFVVELAQDPAGLPVGTEFWVELPRPVRARCAVVTILDVYPGRDRTRAVGISEFHFVSELDRAGGLWRLAEDAAAGRVDPQVAGLLVERARPLGRLWRLLGRVRGSAGQVAARWYLRLGGRPGDLGALWPRLSPGIRRELAEQAARRRDRKGVALVFSRGSWRERALVLERLAGQRESHRVLAPDRVLGWFGKGPRAFREALVGLVGTWPCRAISQDRLLAGRAGLADRLWAVGLRVQGRRCSAASTLAALKRLSWRSLGFSSRFRYLQALGWSLAAGASDAWAGAFLEGRAARAREEVLRWVATRMLRRLGSLRALSRRLADRDPRVRWAALSGLWSHEWPGRQEAALSCLLEDPWPWLRQRCSRLVAAVCPAGAGERLARALEERGLDRAAELAGVLARCRYPEGLSVLRKMVARWREDPRFAADAVGYLAAYEQGLGLVVRVLVATVPRARPRSPWEELAVRAAVSLGASGKARRRVVQALIASLTSPSQRVRQAILDALGRLCPAVEGKRLPAGRRGLRRELDRIRRVCGATGGGT